MYLLPGRDDPKETKNKEQGTKNMKRAIQIVENSIESSKYENRIVWLREDLGGHIHHALLGACEDYAEGFGRIVEYWGHDDDGAWRVHVR